MNVRKLLVCALAVAALASAVSLQAQDDKRKGGRGAMPTVEQRLERLEEAVGSLSAEQKTRIKAIYAQVAGKMRDLPQEERREKMGEILRNTQKEIRAVLTPEQQKKFDAMPQGGRGDGSGGRRKNN